MYFGDVKKIKVYLIYRKIRILKYVYSDFE